MITKAKAAVEPDRDLLAEAAQALIRAEADDSLTELLDASSKASGREYARKPLYTADAMVQLFIDHPEYTHAQYAEYFGYKASWFAGVLISNNLQSALDKRREEVAAVNPLLAGTMHEMFQAATVQAMAVLQQRMEDPKAPNELFLDVAKIGTKALGMGAPGGQQPLAPPPRTIHDLASGLLKANPPAPSDTPANDLTIEMSLRDITGSAAPGADDAEAEA